MLLSHFARVVTLRRSYQPFYCVKLSEITRTGGQTVISAKPSFFKLALHTSEETRTHMHTQDTVRRLTQSRFTDIFDVQALISSSSASSHQAQLGSAEIAQ